MRFLVFLLQLLLHVQLLDHLRHLRLRVCPCFQLLPLEMASSFVMPLLDPMVIAAELTVLTLLSAYVLDIQLELVHK